MSSMRLLAVVLFGTIAGSACLAVEPVPAAGTIRVHPTSLDLRHHRQPQSLQVLGLTADGYSLDLRSQARIASADPRITRVDKQGWVHPVTNGRTQLTVA